MRRSKREAARESAEARRQQRAEGAVNRKALEATREQKISEALQQDRGPRKVVEQILSATATPLLNQLYARCPNVHPEAPKFQQLLRCIVRKAPRLLEQDYITALYLVAQLAWLRPLDEWHPKGKGRNMLFRSLAIHLLAKYPMPALIWGAFFESDATILVPVVGVVTTGGSLFKEIQEGRFPVPLTRKMCHDLLILPGEKFVDGIRTVQIRAQAGDKPLLRAWLATDVGAKIHSRQDEEFWATVLLWFCQNPLLDRRQVAPLLDYIAYRRREGDFSMKGRSPLALIRAMEEWHGELTRQKAITGTLFKPSGFKGGRYIFTGRDKLDYTWQLEEILTAKQLAAEGSALHHCVYSYAHTIEAGYTSIWSMTCNEEKVVTIEVRNQSRVILQARGKYNRALTSVEYKILLRWAQDNCLHTDVSRL